MENSEYIFFNTFYDKEDLRRAAIILTRANVNFKVTEKTANSSARAPLSVYFEADIHVAEADYEKAANHSF